MTYPTQVRGDHLGVDFPTTMDELLRIGPGFLTAAFRAAGVLGEDNCVTAISASREFVGGGAGKKLLLSVEYRRPDEKLHRELFVKLQRDFGDPLRDMFGPMMEPEVRFALFSRREDFPIAVPRCYFADYHVASASGLLISEKIRYGEAGIEPCYEKCRDDEMPDALGHYRALVKAMARLAGHDRAGRFGTATEEYFPYDAGACREITRIPYTEAELAEKLDQLAALVSQAPQLFAANIADMDFLKGLREEAILLLRHEAAIRRYLTSHPDYIALCHWNVNVDNAWFHRGADGALEAGLLDWGMVGQMHVATAFYGLICAADIGFLDANKAALIDLFIEEYRGHGGPMLDRDEFTRCLKLVTGLQGIARLLGVPAIVKAMLPDFQTLQDRRDPRLRDAFVARAGLHFLSVVLNEWQREDIGSAVSEFAVLIRQAGEAVAGIPQHGRTLKYQASTYDIREER